LSTSACAGSVSLNGISAAPELKSTVGHDSLTTAKKEEVPIENKLLEGTIHTDNIVLNNEPYEILYWNEGEFDYTRFIILKDRKISFDSKQAGISFEGGTRDKEVQWVNAVVQNNRPTFMFTLADNRPGSASLVIEGMGNHMEATVQDNVGVSYLDVDEDGSDDLKAVLSYGEVPLSPGHIVIYTWKKDHYEPSLELTRRYLEGELLSLEETFRTKPDEFSLDRLLSTYLLLNRKDDAKKWLTSYARESGLATSSYVAEYENYLNNDTILDSDQNTNWLEEIHPLAKPDLSVRG
jgi:hypothetical protein